MWFAAAAVLVGCGLVLLSLSMTIAKREATGQEAGGLAATADTGAQALFIDQPLATDLAAALAGKTPAREPEKAREPEASWEATTEAPAPAETLVSRVADDDDDTLEIEAQPPTRARSRRRAASHSGRKRSGGGT
jgi:hypothetical protein